jgi:type VI secretion system protein ImpM
MSVALFGKLQSKRDFIAPGASRAFLDLWEPWMQAGLATSRLTLGREWSARYLTAPIWRFWLGAKLCGTSLCGAFMPSLDALGRHHPLVAFAAAPAGLALAPPDADAQDGWHGRLEDFLLGTLDLGQSWEETLAAAQALPDPAFVAAPAEQPGLRLDAAVLAASFAPGAAQAAFGALAGAEEAERLACMRASGPGRPPTWGACAS